MTTHEQTYKDQRDAGRTMEDKFEPGYVITALPLVRRPVLAVKSGFVSDKAKQKTKAPAPKGHEAYLKALESSGAEVAFEKASTGVVVTGVVKTSDKFTVSVQTTQGTRVLFKHDISEFFVTAPAAPGVH